MPTKPTFPRAPEELHRLAESKVRSRTKAKPTTSLDDQRLVHELQVHQVELEMQNEELLEARHSMENLLEKYTDIYDFAPVSYFTLDSESTIRLVNLTGTCLIGIERSKLVGQPFVSLVLTEHRTAFLHFLTQVFASQVRHESDFSLFAKNHQLRAVKIRAQRTPDGQQCNAVIVDITEQRHAEDIVRLSEIRYRRLFEAAHDGVLLLDAGTRKITDANPFMTKLLGYPHEQLVGKELFEIGLLKDETASQEMFRRLKKQHQVRYEDLPLKNRDGQHQEVEVVANLYQESGHAVIQCNIRDITIRKHAEDVLRRNEALFTALLAQAPIGVYVVDEQLRLIQVNPRAMPVFKTISPLIGRDFAEIHRLLWPKRISDSIVARFRHTLKTGQAYQAPEFSARRRDIGTQEIYEWQIQRVTLPSGEHRVVAFFNNITERKRAEWVRRRLDVMSASNEKLEQEIVQRQAVELSLKKSEQHQARLLNQSVQLQKQLRGLSHKILHAQEEERKRISRELHDVVAQTLVGINVHLATLSQDVGASEVLRKKLKRTQQLVESSTDIVHRFARELRPSVLDDLGLIPALHSFMEGFTTDTGVIATLKASAGIEKAVGTRRTVLYRVAQEALTNVARHARATHATITIKRLNGMIYMTIMDDGQGFIVERNDSAMTPARLGLLGMRERIGVIGGSFSITSIPGKNTTVCVKIAAEEPGTAKRPARASAKHGATHA